MAPTQTTPLPDLGWSLAVVLRRWQEAAEIALADVPGDARCYHLLAAVVADECTTQTELARRTAIDRSVLTYLVDTLVDAGLVERRTVPHDRRARHVVATGAGRRVLAAARQRLATAEGHVLGGLPESDRAAFHRIAAGAARAIVDADPDIDPCVAARGLATQGDGAGEPAAPSVGDPIGDPVGDSVGDSGGTSSTPTTSAARATRAGSSSSGGTRPRRRVNTYVRGPSAST